MGIFGRCFASYHRFWARISSIFVEKVFRCCILIKEPRLTGWLFGRGREVYCPLPPQMEQVLTTGSKYLPAAMWVSHGLKGIPSGLVCASLCSLFFLSNVVLVIHLHLVIYNNLHVFSSRTFAEQVIAPIFMQWICLCLSVFLVIQLSPLNFTLLLLELSTNVLIKYRILSLASRILEYLGVCMFSCSERGEVRGEKYSCPCHCWEKWNVSWHQSKAWELRIIKWNKEIGIKSKMVLDLLISECVGSYNTEMCCET